MKSVLLTVTLLVCNLAAWAALPAEEKIQGLYEGGWQTREGPTTAEGRLVALGKESFRTSGPGDREEGASGRGVRRQID